MNWIEMREEKTTIATAIKDQEKIQMPEQWNCTFRKKKLG